jgi:hypothetical protein
MKLLKIGEALRRRLKAGFLAVDSFLRSCSADICVGADDLF